MFLFWVLFYMQVFDIRKILFNPSSPHRPFEEWNPLTFPRVTTFNLKQGLKVFKSGPQASPFLKNLCHRLTFQKTLFIPPPYHQPKIVSRDSYIITFNPKGREKFTGKIKKTTKCRVKKFIKNVNFQWETIRQIEISNLHNINENWMIKIKKSFFLCFSWISVETRKAVSF